MKQIICLVFLIIGVCIDANAQQFKVITSIESIVPSGLGRSRIIDANADRDYKEFSSIQTEDDNTRNRFDRGDIRVKDFEETKLT